MSTQETPSDIVDRYKSLVTLCKLKASTVTVSSVCPRISSICSEIPNAEVAARIDAVNAGLQVMCGEENVTSVDNAPSFHLKDDSINEAYYLDDGIHLTYKATDKLERICS